MVIHLEGTGAIVTLVSLLIASVGAGLFYLASSRQLVRATPLRPRIGWVGIACMLVALALPSVWFGVASALFTGMVMIMLVLSATPFVGTGICACITILRSKNVLDNHVER